MDREELRWYSSRLLPTSRASWISSPKFQRVYPIITRRTATTYTVVGPNCHRWVAPCLEPAQASVAFVSRSSLLARSHQRRSASSPTSRLCRSTCKARSSSGQAQKLTLRRGRIRSGSGRGNNGEGINRCSQRRRIRRERGPTTEWPCPSAAHSAFPSRMPWGYHFGAQNESAGRFDDCSWGYLGPGNVTERRTSFITVIIPELCVLMTTMNWTICATDPITAINEVDLRITAYESQSGENTISAKMITVLTRYRPNVLELI